MQSRCPICCVTLPSGLGSISLFFLLCSNIGISKGASNDELLLGNNSIRNSLVLSTILSQDVSAEEAQG